MKVRDITLKTHPDIIAEVCWVNPSDAAKMLDMNTHNRKIKPSVVGKYVSELLAGEWYPSQNGIGINDKGVIIDGQHRLVAVKESQVGAYMLIVVGLPSAVQEKTDRHAKRSLLDCFTLSGVVNKGSLEIHTGTLLARRALGATSKRNIGVSDVDVKSAIENHKDSLAAVLQAVHPVAGTKGMTRAGCLAAFVHGYEIDPKKTMAFIEKFISGEMMTKDDPPMRLRNFYKNNSEFMSGGTFQHIDYERASYALRCWFNGRRINRLLLGYAITDYVKNKVA